MTICGNGAEQQSDPFVTCAGSRQSRPTEYVDLVAEVRKRSATDEPPPRSGPVTRSQTRLGATPAKNPRLSAGTGAGGKGAKGGNSAGEGPVRPSPSGAVLAHLRNAQGTLTGARIVYTADCTGGGDRPCWIFEDLSLLRLREIAGRHSCLLLGRVNVSCLPPPMLDDLRHAAAIVHYLLTAHHCVTAIDCHTGTLGTYEYLFFDALRRSKFVRSVKLHLVGYDRDNILCAAIPFIEQLKELECSAGKDYPPLLQTALSSFLGKTRSLTALRFPELRMRTEHAEEFLRALGRNLTVRELSLHASIISNASLMYRVQFAEYLKKTKTVKALSLVAHNKVEQAALRWALVGLQTNKSITSLSKNKTLEDLALPMRIWKLDQWRQFFEMLSSKQNLRCVTIEVNSDKHHLFPDCDGTTPYWRVVRQLTVHHHIEWLDLYLQPFAPTEEMYTSIAKGIQGTSTLRKLHLRMWSRASDACWTAIFKALSNHPSLRDLHLEASTIGVQVAGLLAEAVLSSKKLYRVNVVDLGSCQASVFVRALAEDIADNYTLLDLTVKIGDWWPGLEASKAMFAVWDVGRRNSDLVERAVQFATGTRRDRYCAQALQRMSGHPALLERIASAEKISEDEAAATACRMLGSLKGLHQFMRVAGIVKDRVECLPCPDQRTQLHDLNDHCWSLISQYVFLDQIVDPCPRPERF
ncbi:hypothetical protein HPB48_015772 [Haemaphysalis longicornis]|uniref:Uncharacterized protein n=1 Tax=Haemaphysalis longicornis TaxID=44386 RepID=A0A9J6FPJ9_HAELO|nr:hypothetical protein HPB48_015772 [Haemaphysalis longicornis]